MTSLYIHIPFCKSKCYYCSFYSGEFEYKEEYTKSIIRAVKYYGGKTLKTVYIGGGTPSVLSPLQISHILEAVTTYNSISQDCEITVEANPESLNVEFLTALKQNGVNRLSLGVQSLNDTELKAIGRLHTAKDAIYAIELLRKNGFNNISCDLIFGLPTQRMDSFCQNVKTLKDLDVPHISCYNLQLEKGTPIYNTPVPNEETQEKMYFALCNILSDYRHYEISNFCKQGFHSRHNSVYWTSEDYIGLGPSAHSKIGNNRAYFNSDIKGFLKKESFEFDHTDQIDDTLFEKIMLSLRTDSGISLSLIQKSKSYIEKLLKGGFAKISNDRLILTNKGYYLSNTIISDIAAKEC